MWGTILIDAYSWMLLHKGCRMLVKSSTVPPGSEPWLLPLREDGSVNPKKAQRARTRRHQTKTGVSDDRGRKAMVSVTRRSRRA